MEKPIKPVKKSVTKVVTRSPRYRPTTTAQIKTVSKPYGGNRHAYFSAKKTQNF